MNILRECYYNQWGHKAPIGIDNWLKRLKDRFILWVKRPSIMETFRINTQSKRRHGRTILVRDSGRLFGMSMMRKYCTTRDCLRFAVIKLSAYRNRFRFRRLRRLSLGQGKRRA